MIGLRPTQPVRLGLAALLFVVLGSGVAGAAAQDLDALRAFDQANQDFVAAESKDDYLRVAAQFQSILDRGIISGAVLFNLGNAYQRAGERGLAIAAYRQASRLRPRDPVLESNLNAALADAAWRQEVSLTDRVLFWRGWLSLREKTWVLSLLATLAFGCGVLALLRVPAVRVVGWTLLALGALMAVSIGVDLSERRTPHGVVIADEVTARKGNAESYAEAFTEPLVEGDEFTVLSRSGDWIHVRVGRDLDGWIPARDAVLY